MVELLHEKLRRLYRARKKKVRNLTIARVAFILNISRQYVVYWFNGSRRIPREFIDPLCRKILATTPEELLTNTIQISGKKQVVNFSNTRLSEITEIKEYPGLTITEVQTVLQYKKNQVT